MSEPQVLRSAPYFPVAAVAPTVAYYERVLGFRTEYVGGDEFAIVSRDGYPLMFRRVEQPDRIRPSEAQGGTWDAFFWVRDARALHGDLVSRGAVVVYGPVVQEAYQMLELAVRDPDGHVLGFGQAL
jgi:catechol 2,3-dioxygenase-like lactoylglutathione lyase family enzyme